MRPVVAVCDCGMNEYVRFTDMGEGDCYILLACIGSTLRAMSLMQICMNS